MSLPVNIWQGFLATELVVPDVNLYETRCENYASGSPKYVGINITPSASTSQNSWYIQYFEYDAQGGLTYAQLPNLGIGFFYSWDNRATYF